VATEIFHFVSVYLTMLVIPYEFLVLLPVLVVAFDLTVRGVGSGTCVRVEEEECLSFRRVEQRGRFWEFVLKHPSVVSCRQS